MTPCVICNTPTKNQTCPTTECSRAHKTQQQRQARAAGKVYGQRTYNCIRCGRQCTSPNRDAKYCNTHCYNMLRYDTIGRVAEEDKAHRRKSRELAASQARAASKAEGTYTYQQRLCTWCDHMYTPTRDQGHRCDTCKDNRQGAQWKINHGDCATCNKPYISRYTISTCSTECALTKKRTDRSIGKAKRRAVKRNAFVANVHRATVYARDNYKCHICGHKVNRNATVPHPKAATLDHLVALANGGTHEPLNVRTAHFICNSRKRDQDTSHQMLLIA